MKTLVRITLLGLLLYILLVTGLLSMLFHLVLIAGSVVYKVFKLIPLFAAIGSLALLMIVRMNNQNKS